MASSKKAVKAAKPLKSKPKVKASRPAKPARGAKSPDVVNADPTLFDPLTPGEVADALDRKSVV